MEVERGEGRGERGDGGDDGPLPRAEEATLITECPKRAGQ
jgi:hypothetical protein